MKTQELHKNNTYAFNVKGEEKHVSDVERGRKGYYCLGCNAEVEARKGEIKSHYFAHVPTNVKIERKCTYSDETYRHKLAKEILQRIKRIKVPTLYKYPQNGTNGRPMKIRGSRTIEAETVKIERQFYENKKGDISYGRNIDFVKDKEKFLLIQPDVAFFDKDDNPILLIEIVATHKIDALKLSKIRRLGIDTVQVTIPRDSPEGIENCFFRTHRTQWIYNYEQETTTYLQVSKGNNEGISSIDEFQRKLFRTAESFSCRSSQINNLVRGLRKCLESEQYQKIKHTIRGELDRVARNTERNRERLYDLQAEYRKEIEERFELEERALRKEEKEFDGEERRFREYFDNMERRYSSKREEFDGEERKFREHFDNMEGRYSSKREELERTQEEYKPHSQSEIERIEKNLEELGATKASFSEQVREIRAEEKQIVEDKRREEDSISELKKRGIEIRTGFDSRRKVKQQQFRESEERIRDKFDKLGKKSIEAIKNRDCEREPRIRRRLEDTIYTGRRLLSIREGKSSIRALKKIKQLFDSGIYKSWD